MIKKEQQRQPSQWVKNAESQQPSQAALTFLIRQDFFLLEFSGKKSSLPLVALLRHIIQHFWLPATNKLVASTANVCKFFFFFLHVDVQLPVCWKGSFLHCFGCLCPLSKTSWLYFHGSTSLSRPLLRWSTCLFPHQYLTVCGFIRSLEVRWCLPTFYFFSVASAALDLLSPCKIYHQFPASHKITCWDFDIHGKCFLGFFFSFYLPPFLKKATFEESARLFPFLAKATTFFIGLDLVHIGGWV